MFTPQCSPVRESGTAPVALLQLARGAQAFFPRHRALLLGHVAAEARDTATFGRLMSEIRSIDGGGMSSGLRTELDLINASMGGGVLAREVFIDAFRRAGFRRTRSSLAKLMIYGKDLEGADLLAHALATETEEPRIRLDALVMQAYMVAARGGSWSDVPRPLDAAGSAN